jgi:branched-chain amino acid transport system permease protein
VRLLLQSGAFGILVGATYGLAALGLSLAFGVLKVLNVAHGELVMLGGYATFYAVTWLGLDPLVSLPLVFLLLMVFGLILHYTLFARVTKLDEGPRIKNSLLIAFGLVLILQTLAVKAFTADDRSVVTSYLRSGINIGPIRLPAGRLAGMAVAIAAVIILERILTRTTFGKAIRATSENWALATLSGINVRRTYLVAFAISAGLAGITGTVVIMGFSISPSIGLEWTLRALVVVVLAGLGSVRGTVLAGMFLGLVEGVSAVWIGGAYRAVVALVVFVVVLGIRPQGLFGTARV